MRRIFTLLIALPLFLSAQEKGDFELGVGAGLNLSTFHGDDNDDFNSSRTAAQFGVTGDYYVSDKWSLRTGLIHDSKGAETENNGENVETQLDYLFVPLYVNWHFGESSDWYLNFGPYMGFLLSAQDRFEGTILEDDINQFDLGLGAGIGRKFQISDNASVFIEYQSAVGLTEVFDQTDTFNMRGSLNAGVAFTL